MSCGFGVGPSAVDICDRFLAEQAVAERPAVSVPVGPYASISSEERDRLSAKAERVGLEQALSYARTGDTLVVWRLDRLGRSLPHLIGTITGLENRGFGFKSLTEAIDTSTSGGKLVFHTFGALAEFERDIIRERTQASPPPGPADEREDGQGRSRREKHSRWRIAVRPATLPCSQLLPLPRTLCRIPSRLTSVIFGLSL
jgi:hypothetical protein